MGCSKCKTISSFHQCSFWKILAQTFEWISSRFESSWVTPTTLILIIYKCIEASCFFFLSFLPFSLQTDDDDDDDVFCFLCFRLAKTNVVVVVVFVDFSSFDRSLAFFASRLARRSLILTIQPCGCLTFASVVAIFLFFSSRLALSVYINIYISVWMSICVEDVWSSTSVRASFTIVFWSNC